MYPDERSLVNKFKELPFAIVGVNSDENLERLRPVLESEQITWRSFQNGDMDSADSISHRWNVSGWPSTFLIDAQGRIRPHSRKNLEEAIRDLINEGSLAQASPATQRRRGDIDSVRP